MAEGGGEKRLHLLGWLVVFWQQEEFYPPPPPGPRAPSPRRTCPLRVANQGQLRDIVRASELGVREAAALEQRRKVSPSLSNFERVGWEEGPSLPGETPAGIAPPPPARAPRPGDPVPRLRQAGGQHRSGAAQLSAGVGRLPGAHGPGGVGLAPAGASRPPPPPPLGAPGGRAASSPTPPLLVFIDSPLPPTPAAVAAADNPLYKKPLCFPGGWREGREKGCRGRGAGASRPGQEGKCRRWGGGWVSNPLRRNPRRRGEPPAPGACSGPGSGAVDTRGPRGPDGWAGGSASGRARRPEAAHARRVGQTPLAAALAGRGHRGRSFLGFALQPAPLTA